MGSQRKEIFFVYFKEVRTALNRSCFAILLNEHAVPSFVWDVQQDQ